jgi:HEAT repeat protein
MLPIVIDHDVEVEPAKDTYVLTELVRGKLKELLGMSKAPHEDLVRNLLVEQRILLIIDGLSELGSNTKRFLRPIDPNFHANAFVVTSRLEEKLDEVSRTVLRPLRIRGGQLSSFMEKYLQASGQRGLFDDADFFELCRKLSILVELRDSTVLLAKLFADQSVDCKRNGTLLPETIPDLMLQYLNELNRNRQELTDATVHDIVKKIAWISLSKTFRPRPANIKEIACILGPDKYEAQLDYLETKLKIIQVVGANRASVKITLDPLAEYLASLHVVEQFGDAQNEWMKLVERIDLTEGSPKDVEGFLHALRDCCLASTIELPDSLVGEIEKRLGLDTTLIEELRRRQRASQAIDRLASPFADDRVAAAVSLRRLGVSAFPAVRAMTNLLKDSDAEVRKNAIYSLAAMGTFALPAILPLIYTSERDEDTDVRRDALSAANVIAVDCDAPELVAQVQNAAAYPREQTLFATVLRRLRSLYCSRPDAIEILLDVLEDDHGKDVACHLLEGFNPELVALARTQRSELLVVRGTPRSRPVAE